MEKTETNEAILVRLSMRLRVRMPGNLLLRHFNQVLNADAERFVLTGKLLISDSKTLIGSIEYNLVTQSFYRVTVSTNGKIRRKKDITIDIAPDYNAIFKELLAILPKYIKIYERLGIQLGIFLY